MDMLTNFFKVISDETRLRIMILLYHKKLCVCQIYGIMRESQPKISKHLAKLRDMGFVTVERQEQYIFYNLNLREKIYIDILKNIIDNIKDYSVLKEDIKKSENAEKYIEECIKN